MGVSTNMKQFMTNFDAEFSEKLVGESSQLVEAIEQSADFLKDKFKENAPDSFKIKQYEKKIVKKSHLLKTARGKIYKGSIKTAKPKVRTNEEGRVGIWFPEFPGWRLHFVRYGTIRQKPNDFIKKTLDQYENEVFKIIQEEMKKRLGL